MRENKLAEKRVFNGRIVCSAVLHSDWKVVVRSREVVVEVEMLESNVSGGIGEVLVGDWSVNRFCESGREEIQSAFKHLKIF